MSTPKQIAAARANGAKSKGPVSLQGKIASSRNSTRHGLFAETIVLEAEDTGRFLKLVESLFEEHQPRTPTETLLVENIAAARWRQWRILGMQKVAFDYEVASTSTTNDPPLRAVLAWRNSAESIRTHELLLRFEIALDRQISRSLLRLQQLQSKPIQKESAKGRVKPSSAKPSSGVKQSKGSIAPHAVPGDKEKTAGAERTQQTIETVTNPLPKPSHRPPNPVPQSQISALNPTLPIPPCKQETGLPSTARGKFRLARRK